jgi:hypothetical protein
MYHLQPFFLHSPPPELQRLPLEPSSIQPLLNPNTQTSRLLLSLLCAISYIWISYRTY